MMKQEGQYKANGLTLFGKESMYYCYNERMYMYCRELILGLLLRNNLNF
jgi:hypothetical protein